jgi:carboxyl-terminal processing protease
MIQPCRAGGEQGRSKHPGMGKRGAISIGLILFLIAACASTGDQSQIPERFAADPSGALFSGTYRQIRDYYLDPVSIESLAEAGIASLDGDRGGLVIDQAAHLVSIREQGAEVSRLPLPDADDADGWAAVTSAAISAARAHDPTLQNATDEQLYQHVFDGITSKLDHFTRYAGASAARDQKASRDGFGGVGITLDYSEAEPKIIALLPDGPSARAGIKIDDRLTAIDGYPTAGLDRDHIVPRLRGRPDTHVSLTVQRPQQDKPITVAVDRKLIVPVSVTAERQDGIVIFHVSSFNADTEKSLGKELAKARTEMGKGLVGVVLDLRGNPGGLLDQAVDVASVFLPHGQVVATKGRHPTSMQDFEATGNDQSHGLPLVVLVNGGSASSAEIVAAALQDHGRAVLVGSSTYGKGTVQMVVTLANTGELTLTWARLITPSGTILHHHGLVPAFCTSEPVNPTAMPEDPAAHLARILEKGLHPTPGMATRPRPSLGDPDWEAMRKACQPETRDTGLDLKIAAALLKDPTLYAQAIGLPGIAVADDPAGHAMRSALQ